MATQTTIVKETHYADEYAPKAVFTAQQGDRAVATAASPYSPDDTARVEIQLRGGHRCVLTGDSATDFTNTMVHFSDKVTNIWRDWSRAMTYPVPNNLFSTFCQRSSDTSRSSEPHQH